MVLHARQIFLVLSGSLTHFSIGLAIILLLINFNETARGQEPGLKFKSASQWFRHLETLIDKNHPPVSDEELLEKISQIPPEFLPEIFQKRTYLNQNNLFHKLIKMDRIETLAQTLGLLKERMDSNRFIQILGSLKRNEKTSIDPLGSLMSRQQVSPELLDDLYQHFDSLTLGEPKAWSSFVADSFNKGRVDIIKAVFKNYLARNPEIFKTMHEDYFKLILDKFDAHSFQELLTFLQEKISNEKGMKVVIGRFFPLLAKLAGQDHDKHDQIKSLSAAYGEEQFLLDYTAFVKGHLPKEGRDKALKLLPGLQEVQAKESQSETPSAVDAGELSKSILSRIIFNMNHLHDLFNLERGKLDFAKDRVKATGTPLDPEFDKALSCVDNEIGISPLIQSLPPFFRELAFNTNSRKEELERYRKAVIKALPLDYRPLSPASSNEEFNSQLEEALNRLQENAQLNQKAWKEVVGREIEALEGNGLIRDKSTLSSDKAKEAFILSTYATEEIFGLYLKAQKSRELFATTMSNLSELAFPVSSAPVESPDLENWGELFEAKVFDSHIEETEKRRRKREKIKID